MFAVHLANPKSITIADTFVYEGGYCATEFLFSGPDANRTAEASKPPLQAEFSKLLTVMATTSKINSWEKAFIDQFGPMLPGEPTTMEGFYEAMEAAHGQPNYVYEAPIGHCSTPEGLGSCPCCPKK